MNPTSLYRRQIRVLALVVLALVQGGCGGDDADESGKTAERSKAAAKKPSTARAMPMPLI